MARVTRAKIRKTRKKALAKRTKGFFGGRRRYRQALSLVMKADQQAYVGRKLRKRDFRRLWIQRISAATRPHGLSYSKFIHGLKLSDIQIDRKSLAALAIDDPDSFAALVEKAQEALS